MLHDAAEFVYRSEENEAIGMVSKQRTRSKRRPHYHTMRGVLMYSSIAVPQQGLPLGLAQSSSGPGISSMGRTLSSGRSVQRVYQSGRKRAIAGWRT
jgi:hypothetical protein